MSTTLANLPYQRFVRQVATGPSAVIATKSMAEINLIALQSAQWVPVVGDGSTMPPLNFTTNPLQESFDAFKYASDYSAGKQKAYAGMVAYRFQTPADALVGATHESDLTSIALSLYVDRWLIGGVRIAAYTSDDETPSTVWATLREGEVYDDAVLPATDPRADQDATVTLAFPASTAALAYIWVIVSLEDYDSVSPLDVRRLEGGSLVVGQTNSVVFAEDSVAADAANLGAYHLAVDQLGKEADAPIHVARFSREVHCTAQINAAMTDLRGHWAAVTSWAHLTKTVESNPGVTLHASVKKIAIGHTATGFYKYYYVRTGVPKYIASVAFQQAIGAPDAGVHVRLCLYCVPDYVPWPDSEVSGGAIALATATLANSAFWAGLSSAITFGTQSQDCTPLIAPLISSGYAAGYVWPLVTPVQVTDRATLVLCASVERLTTDPGGTQDVHYGLDWTSAIGNGGDIVLR